MTPKDTIRKEYGTSKNFMTPRVLSYGRISDSLVYELSTGQGIPADSFSSVGPQIWGLAVVEIGSDGSLKRRRDLGDCFRSREAVRLHIAKLRRDARHDGEVSHGASYRA